MSPGGDGGDEEDQLGNTGDIDGIMSEADHEDTLKLTLRCGATETVTLTVRQTTLCSSILAGFLKRTGRPEAASAKARLQVDGDNLDPNRPIGYM